MQCDVKLVQATGPLNIIPKIATQVYIVADKVNDKFSVAITRTGNHVRVPFLQVTIPTAEESPSARLAVVLTFVFSVYAELLQAIPPELKERWAATGKTHVLIDKRSLHDQFEPQLLFGIYLSLN